jgi:4-diphosphocytidyl-2-C-methyl-D-erythritol kinase
VITVRVPAKVNLALSVGPLRDDGYHDLVNVFQAVSLFDEVTVAPADRLRVRVEGITGGVPVGEDNLAARAATLLAGRVGVAPDVELSIKKAIPVAGGMAGGSADAAAALVGCAALWGSSVDLMPLAAMLGSDVPFALLGGVAVGLGRGERLTPIPCSGEFHWVFGLADGGLSTPAVYAECDRLRAAGEVGVVEIGDHDLRAALVAGDPKALGAALHNDLQAAAVSLRPELSEALAAGHRARALGAIVSGSGPTCAFLASSAEHATELTAALSGAFRSVVCAAGPVPGATSLGCT